MNSFHSKKRRRLHYLKGKRMSVIGYNHVKQLKLDSERKTKNTHVFAHVSGFYIGT